MAAVTLCKANACEPALHDRDTVLARYRDLRDISRMHHAKAVDFLSADAFLRHARRLGLAEGRAITCADMEELSLAFDLAIHTAPAGRSRAIDRYAKAVAFAPGSDEARVLEAMRRARFAVVSVKRRHPAAGLIVTELFREVEHWLVDEALEVSVDEGSLFATRYFTPDRFAITAGVVVPVDDLLLTDAFASVPLLLHKAPRDAIDDRRAAEAVYRTAIADGIMEEVVYRELDEQVRPRPLAHLP